MNVRLPDGQKFRLDEDIGYEEKEKIVQNLIENWIHIIKSDRKIWYSDATKYFLDSLSNYLVWHKEKEDKGKEDKEVLSKGKLEKMNNHKKRSKEIPFTYLSDEQKELFGFKD